MQYSPKLKNAITEIKAILKQYDIAGLVVLHTPGFTEYLLEISPSYSCAKLEKNSVRFRCKASDYKGDVARRDEILQNTANMTRLLAHTVGPNAMTLIEIADQFDKIVDADHGDDQHTSHETQNN